MRWVQFDYWEIGWVIDPIAKRNPWRCAQKQDKGTVEVSHCHLYRDVHKSRQIERIWDNDEEVLWRWWISKCERYLPSKGKYTKSHVSDIFLKLNLSIIEINSAPLYWFDTYIIEKWSSQVDCTSYFHFCYGIKLLGSLLVNDSDSSKKANFQQKILVNTEE